MKSALAALWSRIGFIAVAVVFAVCVYHAFDPPRLNWGDPGADYNVMESGRNFAHYGFLKLRLTPFLMDPQYITSIDRQFIYTHYPQLPDLMNGVERKVFGLSTLTQFRFVALAFSFSALVFFYLLVREFWGEVSAQVALALWVANPLWIQHADYLHHLPYLFFFGFGCFYFLLRYLRGGGRRWLILAGACLFFTYFASYDYWFFAPIIITIMVMRQRGVGRGARRLLGVLAACAGAAIALKFATNMWATGGLRPFLGDLRYQYLERATSQITQLDSHAAAWPTFRGRVQRYFTWLFYPVALFWALLPIARRRLARRWPDIVWAVPNPWWLALAALPFLYVFLNMWAWQIYPTLLVLPFAVIGAAALVALLDQHRLTRPLAVGVVAAMLANSVYQSISFPKAFFSQNAIRSLRADLDRVSVPGQYVVVNHVFDGLYRYYFARNVWEPIVISPDSMPAIVKSYVTNAEQMRTAGPRGVIVVLHKHVERQLFAMSVYPILAQRGAWTAWAYPAAHRPLIERLVAQRDAELTALVQSLHGAKVAETNDYTIWSLPESSAAPLQ